MYQIETSIKVNRTSRFILSTFPSVHFRQVEVKVCGGEARGGCELF